MSNIEDKSKFIENKLTSIRDIIVRLQAILIWKQPYHLPCIIIAVTICYLLLWLVTIPIISKLCFIGIIITLLDYFLPIANTFLALPNWSEEEPIFNELCKQIAKTWADLEEFYHSFCQLKTSKTKLYYTSLLTTLMLIAWISSIVHNLFLLYLINIFVVLYPGLSHHNIIEQFFKWIKKALVLSPVKND